MAEFPSIFVVVVVVRRVHFLLVYLFYLADLQSTHTPSLAFRIDRGRNEWGEIDFTAKFDCFPSIDLFFRIFDRQTSI